MLSRDGCYLTTSFIIPTLRRPDHLRRCLAAVAGQTVPATEVLVGVRADDAESIAVVAEYAERLPVRVVEAQGIGVIGSMNSCVRESQGEFVALLDDDVEIPVDWLERTHRHFAEDSKVAGVGGRDLLQDHPEWRPKEPLARRVGIFTWYGRSIGNHHRGTGPARKVHVLKGCNCIYRGALLRRIGFDERLRGAGAQVGWELSLAFDVRREGGELVYDPGIQVIHWVAPRHDSDSLHRGAFDPIGLRNMVYNEQLIFGTKAPPGLRLFYLIWTLAWGSRFAPGWVRALLLRSRGDKMAWERCGIAGSAMREVWKQALRLRSSGNSSR